MRLIPVLDLKGGVVVRGVGGRRDEYRPVKSVVTPSAEPVEVALRLRDRFGFREFYIADLDAIAGRAPHTAALRSLAQHDLTLIVDAGLRDVAAARILRDCGVNRLIAALETSPGPDHLRALIAALGAGRVTFSLDLQSGALLTSGHNWDVGKPAMAQRPSPERRPPDGETSPALPALVAASVAASLPTKRPAQHSVADGPPTGSPAVAAGLPTGPSPPPLSTNASPGPSVPEGRAVPSPAVAVARLALECGVHSLILLDLAGVGENRGVPTLGLCRAVRALAPRVELITGGGVRDAEDLSRLEAAGVNGALVASALHNGTLTRADCRRWQE